jgi:hypothetical protein
MFERTRKGESQPTGPVGDRFVLGLKELEFRWMPGCSEKQPGMIDAPT